MKNFNFGENLRRIRVQKGISQDAMAMKMEISQAKYSRVERSECVPQKICVDRAADCLAVPPQNLLPPCWDYAKQKSKFERSMGRPAIIAYRILLLVAFFDMARGFSVGAEITSTPAKIAVIAGFEGLGVIFMYYTEKPLAAWISGLFRWDRRQV